MRLNLWDRIVMLFGVKVTEEWVVIGCKIGRHSWSYEKRKCRNGAPLGHGYFLEMIRCESEQMAREIVEDFRKIAEGINQKNGYAP